MQSIYFRKMTKVGEVVTHMNNSQLIQSNNQELSDLSTSNPLTSKHYHGIDHKESENWVLAKSLPKVMTEEQTKWVEESIAGVIATIQLAYPVQMRNYSKEEVFATCKLWRELFGRVHPQLLYEATMRFIKTDRKGFPPVPGQIIGYIENIIGEIKESEHREQSYNYMKRMLDEY